MLSQQIHVARLYRAGCIAYLSQYISSSSCHYIMNCAACGHSDNNMQTIRNNGIAVCTICSNCAAEWNNGSVANVPIVVPVGSNRACDASFSALTLFIYTPYTMQSIFAPMCYICLKTGCYESNIRLQYISGVTEFSVCDKCYDKAKCTRMHIRFALLCPHHTDVKHMIVELLINI